MSIRKILLIGVLFGVAGIVWLGRSETPEPKPTGPMQFVRLRPTKVSRSEVDSSDIYRDDYFGIRNLYRSDSTTLLRTVANHVCQVTDTIDLQKYRQYIIEYYEYGPNMNETILRETEKYTFHIADNSDAFVYWIIYNKGRLIEIQWHREGKGRISQKIPITKAVRELFTKCKSGMK